MIGVVGDVPAGATRSAAMVYLPLSQKYQPDISLLTRSKDGARIAGEIRALVASMDPDLPVLSSAALADRISTIASASRPWIP